MSGLQGPFGLPSGVPSILDIPNLGLQATASGASLALTLTSAGTRLGFRSASAEKGDLRPEAFTGPLQMVIPDNATLGHTNGNPAYIYVYLLDIQGSLNIAVSSTLYDEGSLRSTTAISASATSATAVYSAGAYTSVPIRCVGRIKSTQATAGTYITAPSEISSGRFDTGLATGYVGQATAFTASGTYAVPEGVRLVQVVALGGGGGGGGSTAADTSGGGGGASGNVMSRLVAVSQGTTHVVTVGAGGAGGASGVVDGSSGGDTSFGAGINAYGGRGGRGGTLGGSGGPAGHGSAGGGDGGTGAAGQAGADHAAGGAGGAVGISSGGGGGGGVGGIALTAAGAGGAGDSAGVAAGANSGGGGGGAGASTGGNKSGGAGGSGYVSVTVIG